MTAATLTRSVEVSRPVRAVLERIARGERPTSKDWRALRALRERGLTTVETGPVTLTEAGRKAVQS